MRPPTLPGPLALEGECRMPSAGQHRPVEILLVEDSEDDARLMVVALHGGRLDKRVTVVEDGEEATSYLRRQGAYAAAARPDLVLLDLHLPRKNGYEVLADIREDDDLRRIPVVVMTSSDSDQALLRAYELHANCCVCKPADQEQFAETVTRIERFWLTVARLP